MNKANTPNIMIGRGALATPNLANVIKYNETPLTWLKVCELVLKWTQLDSDEMKPFYFSSRLKQWYRYLKIVHPQSIDLFEAIKTMQSKDEIVEQLTQTIAQEQKYQINQKEQQAKENSSLNSLA